MNVTSFLQASVSANVSDSVSSNASATLFIDSPFEDQLDDTYGLAFWDAEVISAGFCGTGGHGEGGGGVATLGPGCLSASLNVNNAVVYFVPNVEYNVTLEAGSGSSYFAGAGAFAGMFTSASAEVDPTLSIDPGFRNASEYSLVYGPGGAGGSSTATPEPSSFLLLASGLASLEGLVKRKFRA